jgi:class 3 adenylate cyclase
MPKSAREAVGLASDSSSGSRGNLPSHEEPALSDIDAVRDELAQLRRDLRSAEEREAAVHDVIQAIAGSAFDLDVVLQTVIDRAVHLCHADSGNVARLEGDVYRVKAFRSMAPEYERLVRERAYPPERGSVIGRAALERDVIHITDVLADPEYALSALQKAGSYRTVLGVPMLREGTPIGVIAVARNEVRPFRESEIRLLKTFADEVVVAIENVRLFQTVERQRTELARFAPQVASLLSSDEGEELLAGHRREITALFCDLRGFTAFAETADPEEVLGVLRQYHVLVGELVIENEGSVEHFAGDGLMAFFNDPTPIPQHELAAVRTAMAMRDGFATLAVGWRKRGYDLGLGTGIATGYATLGRIGFQGRYDYAAIGNVVNLASRLSDAAGPGEILLSQRAHAAVEGRVVTEPVPELQLKGFSRPVPAARVIAASEGDRVDGRSDTP